MEHSAQHFIEIYGQAPDAVFFSPGRVNLIGEHIDYNGGLVMPCGIESGIWLYVAKNDEGLIRFSSLNFSETFETPIGDSYIKQGKQWFNYPLGVINELAAQNKHLKQGLNLLFYGNLPVGAGLSSSAAIEVVTAFALNELFNMDLVKLDLVKLCKKVENTFIGVNSGVMDQFAVTYASADKAILLNCETLKYKLVDCDLEDYVLTIIDTNKPRTLIESKYNERVSECTIALEAFNTAINLENLCALSSEELALHSELITDPVVLKRVTHVVKENERVQQAAKALNEGNLDEFGRLMYASHQSLKDLYEVTGPELDAIVDFCKDYPQVIGARMTGAGFGGCAIALLKKGAEADFSKQLTDYYYPKTGYYATIYTSQISKGVTRIS